MQISLNGLQTKHSLPNEFPYEAINPMSAQTETFKDLDDVYKTLFECYDKCIEKGFKKLGEALYNQSLFIVNDVLLIDKKMQSTIRQYKFCKDFNCPPYPSYKDITAELIEDLTIIDNEIKSFKTKDYNGK